MAKKYLKYNSNGDIATQEATVQSAGNSNAGEIVALDSQGRIDVSVLPTGVGPEVANMVCTEALDAGSYVNIWDDAGTPKARLADYTNNRRAHGYVKTAFNVGETATVYFEGDNDSLSSLQVGKDVFLGNAGEVIQVAPLETETGRIVQRLGVARAATIVSTDIDKTVIQL